MTLEEELESVEAQLVSVEAEIQSLLHQKEQLKNKQNRLKAAIKGAKVNAALSTDWEKSDFPWSRELEEKLHSKFKINKLRPFQLSAMNATLSGQDCILVMPTGGGKSLCFQLPALVSKGITLVVSPLVSLMEDQCMALEALDIPVQMLNANSSQSEVKKTFNAMTGIGDMKILYVTPEKLAKSKRFMNKLQAMYKLGLFSRLAVDEVHCCSQWGNDFRPDYKFLGIMKRQFPQVPILGLTATATAQVVQDVQKLLNIEGCLLLKASFNRPNLYYEVRPKPSAQKEVTEEIAKLLKSRFKDSSGIIYCFSIKDSEELSKDLRTHGIKAGCYHANLDARVRSSIHREWMANDIQVIVATVAFGMGIDKPNVRFVIHHSMSKSMENYYQESGRAGRDEKSAHCILLYRFADIFRQSTMVFTEQTGLDNLYAMVRYCIDVHRCRRSLIASHFGENWAKNDCNKMCDHCNHCIPVNVTMKDITQNSLDAFKILNKAQQNENQLTALKLIDAWMGKGAANLRIPNLSPPKLSRESVEHVISYLIIEGYLREDFHFTPYSTISYLKIGARGNMVKNGNVKIEMETLQKNPSSFGKNTPPISSQTTEKSVKSSNSNSLSSLASHSHVKKTNTSKVSKDNEATTNSNRTVHNVKKSPKRIITIDSSDDESSSSERLQQVHKKKIKST